MFRSSKCPGERTDPKEAEKWQYGVIESYGLATEHVIGKGEAFGIIGALKKGETPEQIMARDKRWTRAGPSKGQRGLMWHLQIPDGLATTKREATLLIDAAKEPMRFYKKRLREIDRATSHAELSRFAREIRLVRPVLPKRFMDPLIEAGMAKRAELPPDEILA
jgi:hypothetical protein